MCVRARAHVRDKARREFFLRVNIEGRRRRRRGLECTTGISRRNPFLRRNYDRPKRGFQPGRMNTRRGDYFRLINVARDSARGGIEKFVTPVHRAKILIHSQPSTMKMAIARRRLIRGPM